MPEHLINTEEAASLLGITTEELVSLVKKGDIPAYKIGGQFLRFRKEQIEAVTSEIESTFTSELPKPAPMKPIKSAQEATRIQSFVDGFLDFFYFNDFYFASAGLLLLILWIIFK